MEKTEEKQGQGEAESEKDLTLRYCNWVRRWDRGEVEMKKEREEKERYMYLCVKEEFNTWKGRGKEFLVKTKTDRLVNEENVNQRQEKT